ncbi:flagellar basal body P-ring protein FlgI [Novosphingobium beihaiensis]|uniref:Flagellar P-ring protein n=1 Tax=Novosphingobium beihaiensis TaxID=2930389 RepID=A0ABT0BPL4_9SPHN|nr:flagellar basal body P-ring protein FlgI [Novosphingobium beihaiensis]MCJ2186995.1 flagellar basal body P-ring protein FlgI [Novosphingobium beihaiensis]
MRTQILACLAFLLFPAAEPAVAQEVPLKALGHFDGWRDNSLIGYGLVTGLAGTGDSPRNEVTKQALRNVLSRLGSTVSDDQINSRNVAVVIVTGTLPASANAGDHIDVNVTSIGDARSLAGGTLLMTPLMAADQNTYALAQGPITVGGYAFEANYNREQRNYPNSATLADGATVERTVDARIAVKEGEISFLLRDASFTNANRIAERINQVFGGGAAHVENADRVNIRVGGSEATLPQMAARIENLTVFPETSPRVVINERTGTVVAGGNVRLSSVVISQGDVKVSIKTENAASQPNFVYGFASDVQSLIVSNTKVEVDDGRNNVAMSFPNSTVADLVRSLAKAGIDTRRIISILQAIKASGALYADIIVQ